MAAAFNAIVDFFGSIWDFVMCIIHSSKVLIDSLTVINEQFYSFSTWFPASVFAIFFLTFTCVVLLRVVGR